MREFGSRSLDIGLLLTALERKTARIRRFPKIALYHARSGIALLHWIQQQAGV
jgi:hypothetical protein